MDRYRDRVSRGSVILVWRTEIPITWVRLLHRKPFGCGSFDRSVAIFRETRNGVRPISGFAKNQATAMAFGGPRSSCVRPGAHSARRQDSRNDLAPCRMALHFVSAGAYAPHSDKTPGPTATRGSSHSPRRLRSLAFLCSSNDAEEPGNKDLADQRVGYAYPWADSIFPFLPQMDANEPKNIRLRTIHPFMPLERNSLLG